MWGSEPHDNGAGLGVGWCPISPLCFTLSVAPGSWEGLWSRVWTLSRGLRNSPLPRPRSSTPPTHMDMLQGGSLHAGYMEDPCSSCGLVRVRACVCQGTLLWENISGLSFSLPGTNTGEPFQIPCWLHAPRGPWPLKMIPREDCIRIHSLLEPAFGLGLRCVPSHGLTGTPRGQFPLLGPELGGGRRGVGVDPSLFSLQQGPFQKPPQLVSGPRLADLFIGS